MGLLERWDERNQAWADRKNAEPPKAYPSLRRSRFGSIVFAFAGVVYVVRFLAALVHGAWIEALLSGPFALLAVYVLGCVLWASRWRSST